MQHTHTLTLHTMAAVIAAGFRRISFSHFSISVFWTFILFTPIMVVLCCRLGFTYLRLKDGQMEILNREDEVEK